MSDTVMVEWAKAFVAAQSEMPEIAKSKKATIPMRSGGGYEYSYADLPAIIDAVRPILSKHGLAFAQSVETTETHDISITTRVYHAGGGVQSFGPLLLPGGNDARGAGSAITYGRRYALCAALGIAADEDDDAAGATKKASGEGAVARKGAESTDPAVGPPPAANPSTGTPSPEDPPLDGERPCPHCGHEVNRLSSTNTRAPKWKCSNESCTGHHNTQKDTHEPWVSWHVNPWKPGGEFEETVKAGSTDAGSRLGPQDASSTEPTAATGGSPSEAAAPSDAVAGGGGEGSGEPQPTPQDGARALELIEAGLDATPGIKVTDVIRAASPLVLARPGTKVPTKRGEIKNLPDDVLVKLAAKLKLEQRVPA